MASGINWTEEMLAQFQARTGVDRRQQDRPGSVERRASKYKSEKVEHAGITFDSKKEAKRYAQLEQMQLAGIITELRRQVPFVLAPAVRLNGEPRKKPALRYFADATYMLRGQLVIEDTKSAITRKLDTYRIKKHLMATVHGIQITEV